MNLSVVTGRVGQDPKHRTVGAKNTSVCEFSLCTKDGWGERKRDTWHRVKVWGKQADFCDKYVAKGQRVTVTGPYLVDDWTDKEGGKRQTWFIEAKDVDVIDWPDRDETTEQRSDEEDDDVPF